MIALVCAWIGLFASYLVFAGQASTDELVAGAVLPAAWALGRDRWPKFLTRTTDAVTQPLLRGLDDLYSGLVGDYVA